MTLCGVGGIGKTRLALHVVAMLADAFPDGAWLVELGDVGQPDLVVARVAGTIGVTEETGRPLVETLIEALRPRRLLLALDNCEHLVEACARLCQRLLAGVPGLRVVATSREPLRMPAETVWRVEPLSIPPQQAAGQALGELSGYEAISLFVERAAAARPGFALTAQNAGVVTGLCRALDGVPLAIELAAARVRALSVEQISALLTDRFRLLAVGDRTAPPRQRTLRATIDWSHTLLTTKEQVLLRRLSVFAGWSLDMAEQICADDGASGAGDHLLPGDVLDLITTLVDKSLVVVDGELLGQTRYRLLDSIREYAAERLAAAGETAQLQRRLCDYFLRYLEHAAAIGMVQIAAPWSATVDVFRRCDADQDNMQQVLSGCLAGGDAETGLRILHGPGRVLDRARRLRARQRVVRSFPRRRTRARVRARPVPRRPRRGPGRPRATGAGERPGRSGAGRRGGAGPVPPGRGAGVGGRGAQPARRGGPARGTPGPGARAPRRSPGRQPGDSR